MDAKWNDVADHTGVRLTLMLVGFSAWLVLAVGLLSLT